MPSLFRSTQVKIRRQFTPPAFAGQVTSGSRRANLLPASQTGLSSDSSMVGNCTSPMPTPFVSFQMSATVLGDPVLGAGSNRSLTMWSSLSTSWPSPFVSSRRFPNLSTKKFCIWPNHESWFSPWLNFE